MGRFTQVCKLSADAPTVAVLAPHWGGTDEVCWATRQVAGALACSANIHVITTQGKRPRQYQDGVFSVYELATADRASDRRRDLVLAALGGSFGDTTPNPPQNLGDFPSENASLRKLLVGGPADPWEPGGVHLTEIAPDLVVVADYRQVGTLRIIERSCADVPLVLVPLAMDLASMALPVFRPMFERAGDVLVFTQSERDASAALLGVDRVRFVGLPLAVNPSVGAEPEPHAGGDRDYLLVILGKPFWPQGSTAWADLLRMRFPARRVAVSASDALVVYKPDSVVHESPGMKGASDLMRLMAWAYLTVDMRPGSLFARQSLQSLMYGTPIVVPEGSRAQEHAETGSGGLWFDGPGELVWCIEAMLDPEVHAALGSQGGRYAHDRYGSTDSFVDRVGLVLSGG
jgi:hypothetical protein